MKNDMMLTCSGVMLPVALPQPPFCAISKTNGQWRNKGPRWPYSAGRAIIGECQIVVWMWDNFEKLKRSISKTAPFDLEAYFYKSLFYKKFVKQYIYNKLNQVMQLAEHNRKS